MGERCNHHHIVFERRIGSDAFAQPTATPYVSLDVCLSGRDDRRSVAVRERGGLAGGRHCTRERFRTALRGGFPFTAEHTRSGADRRREGRREHTSGSGSPLGSSRRFCAGEVLAVSARRKVLACDGAIQHNDHYLSDEEKTSGKKIMICCSRVRGASVTLDL